MAISSIETQREAWPQRLRRGAGFALSVLARLIPKTLDLRQQPHIWNALRVGIALLGAALVVVPLGIWSNWYAAVIGLALFVTAMLAPPARPKPTAEERARKLGALAVVDGGSFRAAEGGAVAVHLYVAPERVVALDADYRPVVEIPYEAISSVRAEPENGGWKLRVEWGQAATEFFYEGFHAERRARAAESTLRQHISSELPMRSRAARAGQ